MRCIIPILLFLLSFSANATLRVLIIDTGLSYNRTELISYVEKGHKFQNDEHGHGTHITDLILRNACPQVKIIPCKFQGKGIQNSLRAEVQCLKMGLKLNVDLVNMSLSGTSYSKSEYEILKKYEERSIPVHIAIGNEGRYLSQKGFKTYPSQLKLNNIIRIGELFKNKLSEHTNISTNTRYIAGAFWAASIEEGKSVYMRGTSQATANYTSLIIKKYCEKHLTNKPNRAILIQ